MTNHMDYLKKLQDLAKSLFSMSQGQDLVALELSNNNLRLVHAKNISGKIVIQNVFHKEFNENADADISTYLIALYRDMKSKKKQIICVIPANSFISKNVDMPSRDHEEIGKIVDLQAGRYTPYSREEIVIDYLCMENPGQHYTNVLLVIVHRKIIERYFTICNQAGVEVTHVVPASEAMAIMYDHIADLKGEPEAVGGLHVDADFSDLTIADRRRLIFVRTIPFGAKHFRENLGVAKDEFLKELNKSMMAYQNQGVGRPIKSFLITGLIKGFDFLSDELRASVPYLFSSNVPIQAVAYQKYFALTEVVSKTIEINDQISFFGTMSSAEVTPLIQLDLTPKEEKLRRRFRESGRDMVTLAILIMAIFFMVTSYFAVKIYFKNIALEKLEAQNKISFEQSNKLRDISTKSSALKGILDKRGRAIRVFEKISSLIAEEVYLSSYSYDNEGNIKLMGTAESMSRVFGFVTKLEESKYFDSVKTNDTKSRREGQSEVADFDISCMLSAEMIKQ